MGKHFFFIIAYISMLISCSNKKTIIGKWKIGGAGIVINFINDSTGSTERSDTNTHRKVEDFEYHIRNDTLFEHTPTHLFQPRKWAIVKLDKDSLIIYNEGARASYYRLP